MATPLFCQGIGLLTIGIVLSSCATAPIFPPSATEQVDRSISFTAVKNAPARFQGKTIILGGEILGATRMKEGTRLEVLHLPLDHKQEPVVDRMQSQGRFLAIETQFLDPATLPPGSRISMVGEINGSTTLPLDESTYTYPILTIKNLYLWPRFKQQYRYWPGYYGGPYWGYYWHPWWYW